MITSLQNAYTGLHSTLGPFCELHEREGVCLGEGLGKGRGLPQIFLKVCHLHWVLFGDIWWGRSLPFRKVYRKTVIFPDLCEGLITLWDLHKGLHSALGPSFGIYDRKGFLQSGRSGNGQGSLQYLNESLHYVLGPFLGFITEKVSILQDGLGKGKDLYQTLIKVSIMYWVLY